MLSGVDIVQNERIKRMLSRSPHAIKDIFSSKEIEYCSKKKYPEQSFGARFAAKEAIIKATDSSIFDYHLYEIETLNTESGKQELVINSQKLKDKIQQLLLKEDYKVNVSLSHEKEYSIAQVIIF